MSYYVLSVSLSLWLISQRVVTVVCECTVSSESWEWCKLGLRFHFQKEFALDCASTPVGFQSGTNLFVCLNKWHKFQAQLTRGWDYGYKILQVVFFCPQPKRKQVNFLVCSVTQSCPALCSPMDCSPPGSSVHGIFQARILQWVAISSRGLPDPGIKVVSPALADGFFTTEPPGKPLLSFFIHF